MNALVTGGGGFLGRYIVEQLVTQGATVKVLGRNAYPDLDALGVECIRGDLRNWEAVDQACARCDVVFHTAAIAGIWGRWKDYYEINVQGTDHVLAACHRHEVPRLVYSSSPSVTFSGQDQQGVDETAAYPRTWLAHYPRSKAMAEQKVLKANQPGRLATCALRPHLIWGPRDQHLIPRLIERAQSGRLRIVGDGKNLVDMVYVENAAAAHLQAEQALQHNPAAGGQAFFITQGAPVRLWDWINQILAFQQIPPIRRRVSAPAAYVAGIAFESLYTVLGITNREPRMTRFLARQLATHHYFDIAAARSILGYSPEITTEEGMQKLGAWLADTSGNSRE